MSKSYANTIPMLAATEAARVLRYAALGGQQGLGGQITHAGGGRTSSVPCAG